MSTDADGYLSRIRTYGPSPVELGILRFVGFLVLAPLASYLLEEIAGSGGTLTAWDFLTTVPEALVFAILMHYLLEHRVSDEAPAEASG